MTADSLWRPTVMFDALMAECRRRGVTVANLHATPDAQPIYERYGFRLRAGDPQLSRVAR